MADSVHSTPLASATAGQSKSVKANLPSSSAAYYSPLLCKLFFFLLLLLAIPLLPSQAPDLFNQSFLKNLWELSQLLFIGLAVSYGLFSRRNAETDDHFAADNGSQFTVDECQSSFVSRIFQVSPLFEDSYEVPSECEDKTAVSHVQLSAASYSYTVPDPVAYDGYGNHQSVSVKNGFEIPDHSGGDEVIQAWNAQYFQGQSTAVVSKPNLDVLGQCEMNNVQKPLGLPVRSLNSSGTDVNMPDFSNINISKAAAKSKENDGGAYGSGEEFFGDVSPVNLEEKFNQTLDYSDFSRRSRSAREEETGGVVAVVDRSGHFRPHSGDETQFESLKSESVFGSFSTTSVERSGHFRPLSVDEAQFESLKSESFLGSSNTTSVDRSGHFRPLSADETQLESLKSESFFGSYKPPISSEDGAMQHSATTQHHTKSNSLPSEFPNSHMNESGDDKTSHASNTPVTARGSRMNAFHLRKYSGCGSLFKKESHENSRGVLKEKDLDSSRNPLKGLSENKGNEEDSEKKNKKSQLSLKLDKKAENELLAKPSRRGKSVRTVRSPGGSSTTEVKRDAAVAMVHSYFDDVVGKAFDEIEDTSKKNHVAKIPKSSFAEYKKRDRQRSSEAVDGYKKNDVGNAAKATIAESKKRSEGRKSTSRVSVEPDEHEESKKESIPVSDSRGSAGHEQELDEVDRKAAEFIAKFREQIMLQKVASIERSTRKRGIVKDSR